MLFYNFVQVQKNISMLVLIVNLIEKVKIFMTGKNTLYWSYPHCIWVRDPFPNQGVTHSQQTPQQ